LNSQVSPALEQLFLQMLHKDARQRPTASEVTRVLREFERHSDKEVVRNQPAAGTHAPDALVRSRRPYRTDSVPSIAVLPFVNISNDPDNEYFCYGLAEELLNALSKMEALRVAARTSAFSFKSKETDIREIGQKLNVGAVLEGSVRKAGNRLRITAQLVNVADGYHLWSERYDREMLDIFDIQDEISLSIVDALKVKLLGAEKENVTKRHTDDPVAWEWYQKAVWQLHQFSPAAFSKAIDCLHKAVETDPKFARAWAYFTLMYILFGNFAALDQQEIISKAGASAQKAIELDALLPEAHQALGMYKCSTFDLHGGGQHFKDSLKLNPNQPITRLCMAAFYLLPLGRIDEALTELHRAHLEDPLAMNIGSVTGYALYVGRRYDEALAYLQSLIEMAPKFATHHLEVGRVLMQKGRLEEAIEFLQKSVSLSDISYAKAALGHAYGLAGRKDEALRLIEELQQQPQSDYEVAVIQTGLGNKEEAFQRLEAAYAKRQPILILHLKVEPWFDSLRDDPRFSDLLRRIGLSD
jgi:adenylate cyclase